MFNQDSGKFQTVYIYILIAGFLSSVVVTLRLSSTVIRQSRIVSSP